MNININAQTRQSLNNFKAITAPSSEDISRPDYLLYCCAPFWLPHQASCLLAHIAPLDRETFHSLISLSGIQRDINRTLQMRKTLDSPTTFSGESSYHDYVINFFSIPHEKLDYLKNIYELIENGLKGNSINFIQHIQEGIKQCVCRPEDIIKYAREVGIDIPDEMQEHFDKHRPLVKLLQLPKTFPDQINFACEYTIKKITANQRKAALMPSTNTIQPLPFDPTVNHKKPFEILSSTEKKLSLSDLIYRVILVEPRRQQLNKKGILQLKKLLLKYAPCTETDTLFQQTAWHATQLTLAFYGIDYHVILEAVKQLSMPLDVLVKVTYSIDRDQKICENFSNYLLAKRLNPMSVSIQDFEAFAAEKNIKLPPHWPLSNEKESEAGSSIKESLMSKKPGTLRKEIAQRLAILIRKKEEREESEAPIKGTSKSKTPAKKTPAKIASSSAMKQVIQLVNQLGGLKAVAEEVDAEWFSHLFTKD